MSNRIIQICEELLKKGKIIWDKEFIFEGELIHQYTVIFEGEEYMMTKNNGRWAYFKGRINEGHETALFDSK